MQRKLDNYIQSSAELWAKTMFFTITTSEFCSATSNLTVCGRVLQWAWPVCRVTVTWSGSLPELVCGWCTSPRVARCLYRSICCRRPSLFAMRGMYSDNSSSTTAINCWTTPRRPTERLSSKYDTTYISVCHRSVPSKQNKKPSCRYDSQPYCLTAPSVPTSVYHTLVVALVLSRLDYGNACWWAYQPTWVPVQPSAVSAQRCCAIHRRSYDAPTTSPTHLPVSTGWRSRSVFSLSWRQSSIVQICST